MIMADQHTDTDIWDQLLKQPLWDEMKSTAQAQLPERLRSQIPVSHPLHPAARVSVRRSSNGEMTVDSSPVPKAEAKRLSKEERYRIVVQAAGEIMSAKGFTGMSLQEVADKAGLTESALYHYIHTKSDLLTMILDAGYETTIGGLLTYGHAAGTDSDGHTVYYFPRYCLNQVIYNVHRPELVRLFSTLNGEALREDHPAHNYFVTRYDRNWQWMTKLPWVLPDGFTEEQFHHLWRLTMSAMDGLQIRWITGDVSDLTREWVDSSRYLFPVSQWGHYLDPSQYQESDGCLLSHVLHTQPAPVTTGVAA
jgi:AcrR family transcriptional regulator